MTNQAHKTPLPQLERLILEASPHELMSALALRFSISSKPMTRKIQYKIDIPGDEWVKFATPTAPRSAAHAWDEAEKFVTRPQFLYQPKC